MNTDFKSINQPGSANTPATLTPVKHQRILLLDHTNGTEQDDTPTRVKPSQGGQNKAKRKHQPLWASACRITDPSLNNSSSRAFVTYQCTVTLLDSATHSIRKRYSDFINLQAQLKLDFPDVYTPHLPPKSYSMNQTHNGKFLEQRRGSLELFLRSVVLNPEIGGCKTIIDWFDA